MRSNIKELLEQRNISIKQLSEQIPWDYSFAHRIVNREDLSATQLTTLAELADFLNVRIEELYNIE